MGLWLGLDRDFTEITQFTLLHFIKAMVWHAELFTNLNELAKLVGAILLGPPDLHGAGHGRA